MVLPVVAVASTVTFMLWFRRKRRRAAQSRQRINVLIPDGESGSAGPVYIKPELDARPSRWEIGDNQKIHEVAADGVTPGLDAVGGLDDGARSRSGHIVRELRGQESSLELNAQFEDT